MHQNTPETGSTLEPVMVSTDMVFWSPTQKRLLAALLEEAARKTGAKGGSVFLFHQESLLCVKSLEGGHVPPTIRLPLREKSPFSRVLKVGEPLLITDLTSESGFERSGWPGYENNSLLVLPISNGDKKIIGLVSLHDKHQPPFTSVDQQLIFLLSKICYEKILAEQALEECRMSEFQYKMLVDNLNLGIVLLDSQDNILTVNPAAQTMFQCLPGELAQNAVFKEMVLSPPLSIAEDKEQEVAFPDGRVLFFRIRSVPVNIGADFPNKRVDYCLKVFEDITQQKQDKQEKMILSEQLRQAQKLEAIGQLAGGIAHDFNNLLTAILGNAELLKFEHASGSTLTRGIEQIIQASRRASELTSQLLSFGRKGKVQLIPINIHQMIKNVIALLEHSIDRRIKIELDLAARHCICLGDPSQIQNAFLNLGINARDAMPQGGRLRFASGNVNADQSPGCELKSDQTYIRIMVEDNGTGMSDEVKNRLFEPFFTTKDVGKGTGLGLASVYGCVKGHQGTIQVVSALGRGTRFDIYLPVVLGPSGKSSMTVESGIIKGSGNILLVDDEQIIRNFASRTLLNLGYQVFLANNGEEGVNIFQKKHRNIDLVILDLVMPVMDGYDTLLALQKIKPDVRVLIASGFGENETVRKMFDLGVRGFINKPFRVNELSVAVAKILGHKPISPVYEEKINY